MLRTQFQTEFEDCCLIVEKIVDLNLNSLKIQSVESVDSVQFVEFAVFVEFVEFVESVEFAEFVESVEFFLAPFWVFKARQVFSAKVLQAFRFIQVLVVFEFIFSYLKAENQCQHCYFYLIFMQVYCQDR